MAGELIHVPRPEGTELINGKLIRVLPNGQKQRVFPEPAEPVAAENPVRTQEEVWPEFAEAVRWVVEQGHSAEAAKFLVKKFGPEMILQQKAAVELRDQFVEEFKKDNPEATDEEVENALREQASGSLLQREQSEA